MTLKQALKVATDARRLGNERYAEVAVLHEAAKLLADAAEEIGRARILLADSSDALWNGTDADRLRVRESITAFLRGDWEAAGLERVSVGQPDPRD